jgi:hypothetical protein
MGHGVQERFAHDIHWECRYAQHEEPHGDFALRIDGAGQYLGDPFQDVEKARAEKIIAGETGIRDLIRVLDEVLRD